MFQNLEHLISFAKDKDFQRFYQNPKVQLLMRDPEFERAVKERDVFKLMANQEFQQALRDPEVRSALEEMRRKFDHKS